MAGIPRIIATDEPGDVLATFVASPTQDGPSPKAKTRSSSGDQVRLDIILPPSRSTTLSTTALLALLTDLFLPTNYPHSVTPDYTPYQIYDSAQAFLSSIAGLLSSRAVLAAAGVGDAHASTTAAVLLSVLQDSLGRIATILFAHRAGPALEPDAKTWRLAADVFNDVAMVLECLSPGLPRPIRVPVLAGAGTLKALCGVAAGGSKAALSAHFARGGIGVGELNAKDASQETVVGLVGLLAGSVMVGAVQGKAATWVVLLGLLAGHLWCNYRAVRAVQSRTLNRQRAGIVAALWVGGKVATPEEVAYRERIFEREGAVRDVDGRLLGFCTIGVGFEEFVKRTARRGTSERAYRVTTEMLLTAGRAAEEKGHLLHVDNQGNACIALAQGSGVENQIRAWFTACLALRLLSHGKEGVAAVAEADAFVDKGFSRLWEDLSSAGWDTDTPALETGKRQRFTVGK